MWSHRVSEVYRQTRKKNDIWFNVWFARPLAAAVVTVLARTPVTPNQLTLLNLLIFVVAAVSLALIPTALGALTGVVLIEVSYILDCADGMLARHRKVASQQGHLFDFFVDETKAVLLTASLAVRLWQSGGHDWRWLDQPAGSTVFLLGGTLGVLVVSSAISLTNFTRRPELSGQETPIDAHYETVTGTASVSLVRRLGHGAMAFLQGITHYPSHIWLVALLGRFDLFFWIYALLHALYLARGWLLLTVRFGAF